MIVEGLTSDLIETFSKSANYEPHPVAYLGIDPGKANGICGYNDEYGLVFMATVADKDYSDFLNIFKHLKLIVIEDYTLYPSKAMQQVYSDMPTSRIIGRTEEIAKQKKVQLIKQLPTIKTTGYKWIGKKPLPKSNKLNHELDAHVHFMYWAIRNGRINANSLLST